MGGGEDLPSGAAAGSGRPARLGNDQRPGPAGQPDLRGHPRRHLRPPAAARRAAGLRPRTAAPGWPAAPPWPLRPGPRRTAGPRQAHLQEQLPLHLEPVVEGHVVRHVRPQRLVVDGVGQVRVPHRHRRGHPVLDGAVAQPGHRAGDRAVHLELEQFPPVDPDRPGGVHRGERPAGELEHRVRGVVRGRVVGAARLVPAPRDMRGVPRVQRADRARTGRSAGTASAGTCRARCRRRPPRGSSRTAAAPGSRRPRTPSSRTPAGSTAPGRRSRCRISRCSFITPGRNSLSWTTPWVIPAALAARASPSAPASEPAAGFSV